MAGSPQLKVYDTDGEYVASCKYALLAAALVSVMGEGATIRDGHKKSAIVWTEGAEAISAGDSYDQAAQTIDDRIEARWAAVTAMRTK